MEHPQTQNSSHKTLKVGVSARDIEICTECTSLMKTAAEKCLTWSKESQTALCKGGLATASFVCEGIARSMEECMGHLKKGHH